MNSKTLILFTNSYPYGSGEQYLENELPFYQNNFNKIIFVPINLKGEKREIPNNAEVLDIHREVKFSKLDQLTKAVSYLTLVKKEKSIRKNSNGINTKEHLKAAYNADVYAKALSIWIKKEGLEPENIIFYSYWFYHWVLVMSFLKKGFQKSRYISRAHLYDTYDYLKYNTFGGVKLDCLDKLVCISDHANAYMKNTFHGFESKVITQRLGVENKSSQLESQENEILLFVSCSSMRADKRLDFIMDSLKELNTPCKWIHFGDGELREKLEKKAKALPSNIHVEFKGFVKNNELLKFYRENTIDLFINLSSREGIPVSLMEAISFGIPVLGTNVFGTPELVNDKTGILVDLEDSSEKVAEKIKVFIGKSIDREEIYQFYIENYSAEKNYLEFKKILLNEK